jgi:hypothetical protein
MIPHILQAAGHKKMTKKDRLAAVPDASMLSLCKALVGFLAGEAQVRGWDDVSERLKAVEGALNGRAAQD